jgi:hypothetical protein
VGVEVAHVIDPSSAATVHNPLRSSTLQAVDADDHALRVDGDGGTRHRPREIVAISARRLGRSGERQVQHRRIEALDSSAWRRVESCQTLYRCRTRVRSSGVVMNAAATAAQRRSVPVRGRPNASRATIARQVHNQRSRYAVAVLRSLARSQQGRPTAQIRHLLRNSLTPLGVRLPSATLHQLATDIAAGRPVTLS